MTFVRNPMIQKELRQRMRERRGWILPSLYLLVLSATIVLFYQGTTSERGNQVQGYEIGVGMFLVAAFSQLALLLLLTPIFSAGALTIEKEQRTLAGLLTSLLGPVQIWWGKFVASLLFVLLLLVAALPVLGVAFSFGGLGIWELAMASLTTIVILATVSSISLYWSSVFRRSVNATAVSYVTVILMSAVPWIIFAIGQSRLEPVTWQESPLWVHAPLFLNPIYFLITGFVPKEQLYPEWISCLVAFLVLTAICSLLTLRNIRRSGDVA